MQMVKKDEKSWKVPVEVEDGRITRVRDSSNESTEKTDNFVFKADLEFLGYNRNGPGVKFFFSADGCQIPFSITAISKIFEGIEDGDITVKKKDGDQVFSGYFTFQKRGKHVSCIPISENEAQMI